MDQHTEVLWYIAWTVPSMRRTDLAGSFIFEIVGGRQPRRSSVVQQDVYQFVSNMTVLSFVQNGIFFV